MRSASGTKLGLAASVVAWTNLTIASLAGPAFQEGRGSLSAFACPARLSTAAPPSISAVNSRRRSSISSPEPALSERDAHSAEIDREAEADLTAVKAKDHAVGVGELRVAPASCNRHAGADCRVDARDVAWSMNVKRGADQIGRRDADQGARADTADSERNSLSSEGENAAAARHAEDKTGAGDVQGNRTSRGFGRHHKGCGRETG